VVKAIEQAQPAPYYLPQTKAEALRALAEEIEAHEATQLQLEAAKPKIEHYDRVSNAEGTYSVADVAQMIGTGQNRLFEFLRQQNILFRQRRHNRPYQQYLDLGWFMVRERTYSRGDKEEVYPQVFVLPHGAAAIRKKWDACHTSAFLGNQPGLA
jgi:phage antirepressor YoqD-like protein